MKDDVDENDDDDDDDKKYYGDDVDLWWCCMLAISNRIELLSITLGPAPDAVALKLVHIVGN